MSWGRLDDRLWCHPKMEALDALGPQVAAQATALWVRALSYASFRESPVLTLAQVRRLVPWRAKRGIDALVAVGLWDVVEPGASWRFHGWSEYRRKGSAEDRNDAAAETERQRIERESNENREGIDGESTEKRARIATPRPAESFTFGHTPEPEPEPVPGPSDSGPTDRCEGAAPLALVSPPRKRPKKPPEPGRSAETWRAYAAAFEARYGVPPVSNARVYAQLAQFLARIPADEGPAVARFYVEHSASWYVTKMHPVGALLADAEKLRAEWATGRRITRGDARNAEVFDEMRAQSDRIEAALQRRKEGVS